jgi:hypothetical protein
MREYQIYPNRLQVANGPELVLFVCPYSCLIIKANNGFDEIPKSHKERNGSECEKEAARDFF